MNFPTAKTDNIVVQNLDRELLIYDLTTHKAYTLNETSRLVFEACDGTTAFADLKRRHQLTDDLILFALDELQACGLLVDHRGDSFPGLSRREVIRKVGLTSMIALPLIAGITAPTAAQAASGGVVCNTTQSCRLRLDCGASCTRCTGAGTCATSAGTQSCTALGTACTVSAVGVCTGITYTCTAAGGVCTSPGTCLGTGGTIGTCVQSIPFGRCSVGNATCFVDGQCVGTVGGVCTGTGTCAP